MKYTGNKNFPGVLEHLTNKIPKSNRYFSLFFGGGGLETSKYMKSVEWICSEKNPDCKKYESDNAKIEYLDYLDLIEDFHFNSGDLIFADPPYKFSTRTSGRSYYKFEFNHKQHNQFLERILEINTYEPKILITHPKCDLYDSELLSNGFIFEEFKYMTHAGIFTDGCYTNYEPKKIELLNYNALGSDFIKRQAIKRQRRNIVNKFSRMPFHLRMALINDLKANNLI